MMKLCNCAADPICFFFSFNLVTNFHKDEQMTPSVGQWKLRCSFNNNGTDLQRRSLTYLETFKLPPASAGSLCDSAERQQWVCSFVHNADTPDGLWPPSENKLRPGLFPRLLVWVWTGTLTVYPPCPSMKPWPRCFLTRLCPEPEVDRVWRGLDSTWCSRVLWGHPWRHHESIKTSAGSAGGATAMS